MRVLLTSDAVGGVWTAVRNLAEALPADGVEPLVAVLGPGARDAASNTSVPAIALDLPLDWTAASPNEVLAAGEALAALARRWRVDLVHLHAPAYAAGRAFHGPVAASVHSCIATWAQALGRTVWSEARWRIAQTRAGLRAADAILAPTAAFAAAVARAYRLRRPPRAAPNGHGGVAPDAAGPPRPVAFAAGRFWDPAKDLATLDAAAAMMRAPLAIAGDLRHPAGEAAAPPRHAEALGRLGRAEIAARLAERPVFVSAARYEPFGLAALEAASAGCALVLSDLDTHREVWADAAIFAPPGDPAAFAAAIDALVEAPALRARLADAARRRAQAFTSAAAAAGVADLYRRLVRRGPRLEAGP